MNWDTTDYVIATALFASCALVTWLITRNARSHWHILAGTLAALGALVLVWMQLAVGLIGSGEHPINQAMTLVLAAGAIGSALSRFRASGMRTTMLAVAGTQMTLGALGFILATPDLFSDVFLVTTFFAGIWTGSAFLFHLAYRREQRA